MGQVLRDSGRWTREKQLLAGLGERDLSPSCLSPRAGVSVPTALDVPTQVPPAGEHQVALKQPYWAPEPASGRGPLTFEGGRGNLWVWGGRRSSLLRIQPRCWSSRV